MRQRSSTCASLNRAIDQYLITIGLEPNFALAHQGLGDVYEQKGMQKEAIAEME
jgi:hypothetical protein